MWPHLHASLESWEWLEVSTMQYATKAIRERKCSLEVCELKEAEKERTGSNLELRA